MISIMTVSDSIHNLEISVYIAKLNTTKHVISYYRVQLHHLIHTIMTGYICITVHATSTCV